MSEAREVAYMVAIICHLIQYEPSASCLQLNHGNMKEEDSAALFSKQKEQDNILLLIN